MRFVFRTFAVFLSLWLTSTEMGFAHGVATGNLVIDHPYATPSLGGVANGSAYFRGIKNKGDKPDRLLSAKSSVAERAELHRMITQAGVMRMREVPAIDLPAGQTTRLRHGGQYHLMLINLKQPLKDGDRFDLTLHFEHAGTQTVKVWVQTPRDVASDATHNH